MGVNQKHNGPVSAFWHRRGCDIALSYVPKLFDESRTVQNVVHASDVCMDVGNVKKTVPKQW